MTNRRPHILECVIIKFNAVVQFQESDLAGFRFKMHKMLIQANEAPPMNTTLHEVGNTAKLNACAGIQNIQLD